MKNIFTLALAALLAIASANPSDSAADELTQRPKGGQGGMGQRPQGQGGKPQGGGGKGQRPGGGGGAVAAGPGGGAKSNPFQGGKMYANNFYAAEVAAALQQLSDPSLRTKAAKAADIPSFFWLCVYPLVRLMDC